jgi:hypothetical protein
MRVGNFVTDLLAIGESVVALRTAAPDAAAAELERVIHDYGLKER